MTPLDYANEIVLPAVREALEQRGDRRRVYTACILTYHLGDYLTRDHRVPGEKHRAAHGRVCEAMRSLCRLSFEVVQGITNGTKHGGNESGFRFEPGSERHVPQFAFGHSAWGHARWGTPGLSVEIEGKLPFLDVCVQVVLQSFKALFPDDLDGLDLSFLDAATVPSPESLAKAIVIRRPAPRS